jgi:hypothetical protein
MTQNMSYGLAMLEKSRESSASGMIGFGRPQ